MDINQIAGPAKDPVAHVEEETQLKGAQGPHAVQAVKPESDSRQAPHQEPPSFNHLHQDPLQLLLRAITARLGEVFTLPPLPRALPLEQEQALTPEVTTARVLRLVAAARDHYNAQPEENGMQLSIDALRAMADTAIQRGFDETRDVLRNLGMLDAPVAAAIDRSQALIATALQNFTE